MTVQGPQDSDQDGEVVGDGEETLPGREGAVDMADAGELVEVYQTDNDMAAAAVIDVLSGEDIEAFQHDRRMHALPAPASEMGTIGIAVHAEHAQRAYSLLEQAFAEDILKEGIRTLPPRS